MKKSMPTDRLGSLIGVAGAGLQALCEKRTGVEGPNASPLDRGRDLEFRVLGLLEIVGGENRIVLRGIKLRAVLAMLLLRPNEVFFAEQLIEGLWEDGPPASAANTVQSYVSKLRKAIGAGVIETSSGGYVLTIDRECIDSHRFRCLVRQGKAALKDADIPRAARLLSQSLQLWRGSALADFRYEPFAQAEIASLDETRLSAEESRAEAELALGHHREVVGELSNLVVAHPLREALWAHLIVALYRCGRQAEALRSYAELRRRLGEELGIEPSAPLQQLEMAVLRHSPDLDWTALPSAAARSALGITPRLLEPSDPEPPTEELALVGRQRELKMALADLVGSPAPVLLISGAPGIGKSRFLSELALQAGVAVLSARASLPERNKSWSLAASLFADALRVTPGALDALPELAADAVASIVPDLAPRQLSPKFDDESRRALLLEAGLRLLTAAGPDVLVAVDDAQWADSASLALLLSIAAHAERGPMLVAFRAEEVTPISRLAGFLDDLHSLVNSPIDVALGPLSEADVATLFSDMRLAEIVADATDGSPRELAGLVRALAASRAIDQGADGRWRSSAPDLGATVRDLARDGQRSSIQRRLKRQRSDGREMLQLLALMAGEAPLRVLATARGSDQTATLGDLTALARSRLVRLEQAGWCVAHDVVREVALAGLGASERGRLHQMLAMSLTAEGGDPAEVARHWEGAGDREAGASSFAEAAERRLGDFAWDEAVALANAGLGLTSEALVRTRLLEGRASAREHLGDLRGAREDLRQALRTAPSGSKRARLLAHIALLSTSDDVQSAERTIEVALTEAKSDRRARAEVLAVAAIVDGNVNNNDRAQERSAAAVEAFEELGDAQGVASALDANANSTFYEGHLRTAAEKLERVARLYGDSGRLLRVGTPLSLAAWSMMLSGRIQEGLERAEEALALERTLGQIEGEAFSLWVRSEILLALGEVEEAKRTAEIAVAMNNSISNPTGVAISLCALAMTLAAGGDGEKAQRLLAEAMEKSHGLMPYAFAAGRLATLAMARGDLSAASQYAETCLKTGIEVTTFEGRLVQAEVGLARREPEAAQMAARLLADVEAEGYVTSLARTRLLVTLGRVDGLAPGDLVMSCG